VCECVSENFCVWFATTLFAEIHYVGINHPHFPCLNNLFNCSVACTSRAVSRFIAFCIGGLRHHLTHLYINLNHLYHGAYSNPRTRHRISCTSGRLFDCSLFCPSSVGPRASFFLFTDDDDEVDGTSTFAWLGGRQVLFVWTHSIQTMVRWQPPQHQEKEERRSRSNRFCCRSGSRGCQSTFTFDTHSTNINSLSRRRRGQVDIVRNFGFCTFDLL
jgi:hypothetical protein